MIREVGLGNPSLCTTDDGIPGTRKSRTGSGVLCRYFRGVSWRNARAAEDEVDALSCEQLLVIDRVAMVVDSGNCGWRSRAWISKFRMIQLHIHKMHKFPTSGAPEAEADAERKG